MTDPVAALRSLFLERCRTDLEDLGRLLDKRDVAGVGVIVHRLAGAAGSFGFSDISAAALVVDQQIRDQEEAREVDLEYLLGLLAKLEM